MPGQAIARFISRIARHGCRQCELRRAPSCVDDARCHSKNNEGKSVGGGAPSLLFVVIAGVVVVIVGVLAVILLSGQSKGVDFVISDSRWDISVTE
jgi:hypothetical protein